MKTRSCNAYCIFSFLILKDFKDMTKRALKEVDVNLPSKRSRGDEVLVECSDSEEEFVEVSA